MKKFTWGHGIALALLSFIGFILYLIFIFPIGKQNSELVTENYYEDELDYQKVIDAKKNAETLPEKPLFAQLPYGIRIAFPEEIIDANTKVHFQLYNTGDKTKDRKGDVSLDNNHTFLVPKELMTLGSYTLKVRWNKGGQDYQVDYDLQWK
jgi:hypothetical protein